MMLSLLNNIQTSVLRRVRVNTRMMTTDFRFGSGPHKTDDQCEYISEVRLHFRQIGPEWAAHEVQADAARAFAHNLYGPVLSELHELRKELWEQGQRGTPAIKRVEAMMRQISELSL